MHTARRWVESGRRSPVRSLCGLAQDYTETGPMAKRNRAAEATAKGKRLVAFEISQELDGLIDEVAEALKGEMGSCTRVQALERMGREGAKRLLGRKRKSDGGT